MSININTEACIKEGVKRDKSSIKYIVIHNTAGGSFNSAQSIRDYNSYQQSQGTGDNFCGAHYFIDKLGNIFQAIDTEYKINHCGGGTHNPNIDCTNANSIGIEMVDDGNATRAGNINSTTEKYCVDLCRYLITQIPTIKNIYRHSDVCGVTYKYCPRSFIGKDEHFHDGNATDGVSNGKQRFENFKRKVLQNTPDDYNNTDFVSAIKAAKKYCYEQGWTYSQTTIHDLPYNGTVYKARPDCSGLASFGLSAVGIFDNGETTWSGALVYDTEANNTQIAKLMKAGATRHTINSYDECVVGDILCNDGHVEIYAGKEDGKHKVWNWGSAGIMYEGKTNMDSGGFTHRWTGHQGIGGSSSDSSSITNSPSFFYESLTSDETNAIIEANKQQLEKLKQQGYDAEIENGYTKIGFSKKIKDVAKYSNVHKLAGMQWNPSLMKRKDFKQDYVVVIRKKLYFAAAMGNEENYLRLYVMDNWSTINTNHSVASQAATCNVTVAGGVRVVCINNEQMSNWTDYDTLINSLLSIDNEGTTNDNRWLVGDDYWNDTNSVGVNYKSLMNARKAKYGWRFAEKCDFEPMDELIVYAKSRYSKDNQNKYIFRKIFFGFISDVQKNFSSGNVAPKIQIQAEDQVKLLKQSYVNQKPSYMPGRYNQGYLSTSFETDKDGYFKIEEPFAYGMQDLDSEQIATLTKAYMGENLFYGQYPEEIIRNMCLSAGIPSKYLQTRIEPVRVVPYLFSNPSSNYDGISTSFKSRDNYCQEIANTCFMEFFFDEDGNAVFKIPSYVLGTNMLVPNNDYTNFNIKQIVSNGQLKRFDFNINISHIKQLCTLVEPMIYSVEKDQTLRQISQEIYGTPHMAVDIQTLNISQCQKYGTSKPLDQMDILILKFDLNDLKAKQEYRDLRANNFVTNFATRLHRITLGQEVNSREMTASFMTDSYIRYIRDEDLISFTLTQSDKDIYTGVEVVGQTFMGTYDSNPMIKVVRSANDIDAIMRYGVKVAPSINTPLIDNEQDAELLAHMILLKSYASQYTAQVSMIEDCDIRVGMPIRLNTYDEHPQQEDEFYANYNYNTVFYINSISRSINASNTSTMNLSLTAGRVLGQESIFDTMANLYCDFYEEPKTDDLGYALSLVNDFYNSKNSNSTSSTDSTDNTPSSIQSGTTIQIPDGYGVTISYMAWDAITSRTSQQWKLIEKYGKNYDSDGFGYINVDGEKRYTVAMTTKFGSAGQKVDVHMVTANGKKFTIKCILADQKRTNNTAEQSNEWGHNWGKTVLELVVKSGIKADGAYCAFHKPDLFQNNKWSRVESVTVGNNVLE